MAADLIIEGVNRSMQGAGSNDQNISALKDIKSLTRQNTARNENLVQGGEGENPVASTSRYSDELPTYRVFPAVDGRPHWMTVDKWILKEQGEISRRSVRCVGCRSRLVMPREEMKPMELHKVWKQHKTICEEIAKARGDAEGLEENFSVDEEDMDVSE